MKKLYLLFVLLLLMNFATLKAQNAENYEIKAFDNVTILGYFDIYIVQKADYSLKIEADSFTKKILKIQQNGNNLSIEVKPDQDISLQDHKAKIWISAPVFNSLEISGALHLECENTLKSSRLNLEVNGATRMEMNLDVQNLDAEINGANLVYFYGKVKNSDIELNGAGQVKADELRTENVKIAISGAGKADVFATRSLDATIDGVGLIRYTGNPDIINEDISFLGVLTEL